VNEEDFVWYSVTKIYFKINMVGLKINKHLFLHGALKCNGNLPLSLGMQGRALQGWCAVDELDKAIQQKCNTVHLT